MKYKLYKVTVEKEFVVAAPEEQSIQDVENSVENIMIIHESSLRTEGLSNVVAEEIKDQGGLPTGWWVNCLPYVNHTHISMPEEIVNKTIADFLKDNGAN